MITGSKTSNKSQTRLVGNGPNADDFLVEFFIRSHTLSSLRVSKERSDRSVISVASLSGGTRLRSKEFRPTGQTSVTSVLFDVISDKLTKPECF